MTGESQNGGGAELGRNWLGIDITHLAVALMKNRLKTAFDPVTVSRVCDLIGVVEREKAAMGVITTPSRPRRTTMKSSPIGLVTICCGTVNSMPVPWRGERMCVHTNSTTSSSNVVCRSALRETDGVLGTGECAHHMQLG